MMHPKVAAATLGGSVATVLVWVLSLLGLEVPAEVAAAFATLAAGGLGFLKADGTA